MLTSVRATVSQHAAVPGKNFPQSVERPCQPSQIPFGRRSPNLPGLLARGRARPAHLNLALLRPLLLHEQQLLHIQPQQLRAQSEYTLAWQQKRQRLNQQLQPIQRVPQQ